MLFNVSINLIRVGLNALLQSYYCISSTLGGKVSIRVPSLIYIVQRCYLYTSTALDTLSSWMHTNKSVTTIKWIKLSTSTNVDTENWAPTEKTTSKIVICNQKAIKSKQDDEQISEGKKIINAMRCYREIVTVIKKRYHSVPTTCGTTY